MPSTFTDRLLGVTTSTAVKAPVRAATTANITLSGLQTIDGVALAEGDRVLVKDQTAPSENGIRVASAGAWVRSTDFDDDRDVRTGTLIFVNEGSESGAYLYRVTTADPIVPGTTSLAFSQFALADLTATAFAQTILAAVDAAAVRVLLELVKQANAYDATSGRVLLPGAFGLGGPAISAYSTDADLIVNSGTYLLASGASHSPDSARNFIVQHFEGSSSATAVQVAYIRDFGREGQNYTRVKVASVWYSWAPISGNKGTVTSATLASQSSVDVSFSDTATKIRVVLTNVTETASGGSLYFRVRESGLGVVTTGVYDYQREELTNAAAVVVAGADAAAQIDVSGGASVVWNGVIYGHKQGDANEWHFIGRLRRGATRVNVNFVANVTMGAALNGFRLQLSANTFASGTFTVEWEA